MILPAHYYYANDDPSRPRPLFPAFSPYPQPSHAPPFLVHAPPFMPQQYSPPARPAPSSLLNDPAFSPDPRSNPHFFSMNDREEIYPSSVSDSLSDYAPTVADDESELDHASLPPRMRLFDRIDAPPPQHARSQSALYPPVIPSQQHLLRSSSARVIPVPPPLSHVSTPGPHLSKESLHTAGAATSAVYPSASLAAQELWNAPPPYSDSETDSSSSPDTPPSDSPPSSSSSLLKDHRKSAAYVPFPESQPPSQPSHSDTPLPQVAEPPIKTTPPKNPAAPRPAINPRNASAPELHPPPPPIEVPPRPSTVPVPAPPSEPAPTAVPRRRRNSKNPSIVAAPRDLDRIDELDESDPRGFAWHHNGPYEAIAKAASTLHPDPDAATQKRTQGPKRKPVQPYNSAPVGVAPGQIFPSFSQYQSFNADAQTRQFDPSMPPLPPSENFPVTSPPTSPLMLPVQRRVPPTGPAPPTPEQYSNMHMGVTPAIRSAPLPGQEGTQMRRQQQHRQEPPLPQHQRPPRAHSSSPPANGDVPQPSPPLTNPYSPAHPAFPSAGQSRHRSSPPASRPVSVMQHRSELPPSDLVPRPDISFPPQQAKKSTSLLPRHLPKRLVMPAPLQQTPQNQAPQAGQAHVEVSARWHSSNPPTTQNSTTFAPAPAPQQQQKRAKDIPMSQGPKLLKKRNTVSGIPQPELADSNAAAAMFAAHVRFKESQREETKEERKKREKEQAKREKEEAMREKKEAKKEKERAKMRLAPAVPLQRVFRPDFQDSGELPLQGIFRPDYVREAELAREREQLLRVSSKAGRKLSKRR